MCVAISEQPGVPHMPVSDEGERWARCALYSGLH